MDQQDEWPLTLLGNMQGDSVGVNSPMFDFAQVGKGWTLRSGSAGNCGRTDGSKQVSAVHGQRYARMPIERNRKRRSL